MTRTHIGLIGFAAALTAGTFSPTLAAQQHCGAERWAIKTGTDTAARHIDFAHPETTTVAHLITLPPPHPIPPTARVSPTETTVFVVDATLTDYKFESGSSGDADYHLVLQDDSGHTMVAEIPSPGCVGAGSPFAARIAGVRAAFDARLTATSSFQTANIPVRVMGVGMFDFAHGQRGAAPNVIELHPVLGLVFNPAAPGQDFVVALSAGAIRVPQGGSSSLSITATSSDGTPADVSVTAAGLPAGVTADVTAVSTGTAMLSVAASAAAATGSFPITITGTAGERSHSRTVPLEVTASGQTPGNREWEYQVISARSEHDVIVQADTLGAQGWEMVGVVRVGGSPAWRAFFKRPKQDF